MRYWILIAVLVLALLVGTYGITESLPVASAVALASTALAAIAIGIGRHPSMAMSRSARVKLLLGCGLFCSVWLVSGNLSRGWTVKNVLVSAVELVVPLLPAWFVSREAEPTPSREHQRSGTTA